MYKIILIFLFFIASNSFAQLGVIDNNLNSTPPYSGQQKLSSDGNKVYFRGILGTSKEIVSTNNTYTDPSWISLTKGNITSNDITITGGTNSVFGSGVTLTLSSLGRVRHFTGAGNVTNTISSQANIGDIYFDTTNGTVYQKSNLSFPSGITYITLPSGTWVKLGDFTLNKSKVGLSNVDNTSDLDKPISTATQAALDLKLSKASNLSDLSSASTARTNLGLGSLATLSTVNLTSNVIGILPIANGGTGLSSLGSGIQTFWSTPSSANFASAITDETGTGSVVLSTSPTLVTPNLGTPSAATLTNAIGLPVSTGISGLGSGVATFLATPSSANLLSALTTKTGTGNAVFSISPTFSTDITSPKIIGGTGTTSTLSLQSTSGVGATGANINFLVGNNGATNAMSIFNTGNIGISTTTDVGYKADISGTLRTTGASYFATSSGSVGIGTTTPDSKLVSNYGTLTTLNTADIRTTTGLLLTANDPINTSNNHGVSLTFRPITNRGAVGGITVYNSSTNKEDDSIISFFTGSGGYPSVISEKMRINGQSGNIGIGTTTPTSKLQVVGLPVYADNTNAIAGGLTAGAFYRTAIGVLMVVF